MCATAHGASLIAAGPMIRTVVGKERKALLRCAAASIGYGQDPRSGFFRAAVAEPAPTAESMEIGQAPAWKGEASALLASGEHHG